ncbi:legume-like lectin [Spinellus fusiger]|nr:legume-like lectin [Spinellus fusiger]
MEDLRKTHTFKRPYVDEFHSQWYDFGGHCIIDTSHHARLTSAYPDQWGSLWAKQPLVASDFEVEFEFKVGGGQGPSVGEGFAVWLTTHRGERGPAFGSRHQFNGLGLFFDTRDNEQAHRHSFPYVSAMLGDGHTAYDAGSDGHSTALAGCEAGIREVSVSTRARVTYQGAVLTLDILWREEDVWEPCFIEQIHHLQLPKPLYLGFTAQTGQSVDNHDIISITARSLSPAHTTKANKANEALTPLPPYSLHWRVGGLLCVLGLLWMAYRRMHRRPGHKL